MWQGTYSTVNIDYSREMELEWGKDDKDNIFFLYAYLYCMIYWKDRESLS